MLAQERAAAFIIYRLLWAIEDLNLSKGIHEIFICTHYPQGSSLIFQSMDWQEATRRRVIDMLPAETEDK